MKDLFSNHAADYSKYRPQYPASLFRDLSRLSKGHECVWDVGTGNGQFARELVHFFDRVIATDISDTQLAEAYEHPQIFYHVASDVESKIASGTVDFITVAQAFHWFRHDLFFKEVQRVAKPGARLAIVSYSLSKIDVEVDPLVLDFYSKDLRSYWEPEREHVDNSCAKVNFPFKEIPMSPSKIECDWTANQFVGYLGTWSALKKAEKTKPRMLADFSEKLFRVWGQEEKRKIVFPLMVRAFELS